LLELDPLLSEFHKEEKERNKLYSVISGLFSYLESCDITPLQIKTFRCERESFSIETVDNKGQVSVWNGFSGKIRKTSTDPLTSAKRIVNVCLGKNAGLDSDPFKNYLIISERNRSKVIENYSGQQKEVEIVNFYPFPYYEKMPVYEKFSILRSVIGIRRAMLRNDLIAEVTKETINRSLGMSTYDLWESISKILSEGVEAGLLEETSEGIKMVGFKFTSRRKFMEIYDRYFLKVNKTTLYDF
jgi:hypothetical protein